MVSPVFDEMSKTMDGEVLIGKVNVDEEQELAAAFEIMSIPTVMVFKNGKITDTLVGVRPRAEYQNAIK